MAEITVPEEWRVVADFPDYSVSNLGRVRRDTTTTYAKGGKILSAFLRGHYLAVNLCKLGDQSKLRAVHILVCEAFIGLRPSPLHEAAHGDGNPMNCNLSNLRWATPKENAADRDRHGRTAHSERGGMTKLTTAQVHEIRSAPKRYGEATRLARKFGVTVTAICSVRDKKNWRRYGYYP